MEKQQVGRKKCVAGSGMVLAGRVVLRAAFRFFRNVGKHGRIGNNAKYLNRAFRYMINSCYLYMGKAEPGIQKRATMINDKERMYLLPHLYHGTLPYYKESTQRYLRM